MKVGAAFSESIYKEKQSIFHKRRNYHETYSAMRGFILPLCIIVGVMLLFGKLFFLQIIQGSYFRNISNSNRLRTAVIHAPRGIITDRNGKPLVFNSPGFREITDKKPKVITQKEAVTLLAKGDTNLEIDSLRNYPYKDIFSHILGYTSPVSQEELQQSQYASYRPGDFVGQMGIEKQYESLLRGVDGKKLTEVDAVGKQKQTLGQTDPIPGQNIAITVDANLQEKVFDAMKGVQKGAAIVSSPQGEILAMVSKPSFDPNLFTLGKSYIPDTSTYANVSDILLDNQKQPLLNRPVSGLYPPGSTFKLVTAAGALEKKLIDENYTVDDTGILKVGDFSFANWYYTSYGRTEGKVTIVSAIKRSNDIFFYKMGGLLGVDQLSQEASQFGLGKKLGIDLPGEASGLVPTKTWKKKVIGEDWYLGDDYHYGIGQGYLLTTPLQVNTWTQAIANQGVLYQPRLLKNTPSNPIRKDLLTEKNFTLIRQGMIEACSPGGVAWPLFKLKVKNEKIKIDGKNFLEPTDATDSGNLKNTREVSIACKTGTAEQAQGDTKPHAWITLFAPAFNPQVVVTVLSEDSGEGSNVAAPVAKDILTAWFEK